MHASGQTPYADQHPHELISLVLRGFTLAYSKTIDLAYLELGKGHVLDGEDCWLDHYGLPIEMADSVDEILDVLDQAMDWLDHYDDPWMQDLAFRIEIRKGLLDFLNAISCPATERDSDLRYLSHISKSLSNPVEPGPSLRSVFDVNMNARLRQSMPLPLHQHPSLKEAWAEMQRFIEDLALLNELIVIADPFIWQLTLRARAWRQEVLPLTRSLYKSILSTSQNIPSRIIEANDLVARYIADQTGLPVDIMAQLDTIIVDTRRRQQFAIWRDIINGYTMRSFTSPLQNRARQYRDYLAISFAWYERAAMAEYLSDDPRFHAVAKTFHAARLDCLLEAALAAFDLELVIPAEEAQAWWWICALTTARSQLGLNSTWLAGWARAWRSIAAGMQSLLFALSLDEGVAIMTKERFNLRYKWARKIPTLPNGLKYKLGLRPEFSAWQAACACRDARNRVEAQAQGLSKLREGASLLNDWALRYQDLIPVRDLKDTVDETTADIAALAQGVSRGATRLKKDRRRWIPRWEV